MPYGKRNKHIILYFVDKLGQFYVSHLYFDGQIWLKMGKFELFSSMTDRKNLNWHHPIKQGHNNGKTKCLEHKIQVQALEELGKRQQDYVWGCVSP